MFRLNFWPRSAFPSPAHSNNPLDGSPLPPAGRSSFLSSPLLQQSSYPGALSASDQDLSASTDGHHDVIMTSHGSIVQQRPAQSYQDHGRGDVTRSPTERETAAFLLQHARIQQKHHSAFGASPFPYFRQGAGPNDAPTSTPGAPPGALPYPQLFSQLHQNFFRNQLDAAVAAAAAAGLHHPHLDRVSAAAAAAAAASALQRAGVDSRRIAGALFRRPGSDRGDAEYLQGIYRAQFGGEDGKKEGRYGDDVMKDYESSRRLHDMSHVTSDHVMEEIERRRSRVEAARGKAASARRGTREGTGGGEAGSSVASGGGAIDGERSISPAAGSSATDSDQVSDHVSDRVTPNDDGSKGRWSCDSRDVRCPICKHHLRPADLSAHLVQEVADLKRMYESFSQNSDGNSDGMRSHCRENMATGSGYFSINSSRNVTSKSRYETFVRVRINRETRLAKIRNRRKRSHDQLSNGGGAVHHHHHHPLHQSCDISGCDVTRGVNQSSANLRDGRYEDEETIDVISFDADEPELDKENDWSPTALHTNQHGCGCTGSKQHGDCPSCRNGVSSSLQHPTTEDKSTRTDDCDSPTIRGGTRGDQSGPDQQASSAATVKENISTCAICMQPYTCPVISVQCWHVHCEHCWLQSLGGKSVCPQCDVTTTHSDLKRIFI